MFTFPFAKQVTTYDTRIPDYLHSCITPDYIILARATPTGHLLCDQRARFLSGPGHSDLSGGEGLGEVGWGGMGWDGMEWGEIGWDGIG